MATLTVMHVVFPRDTSIYISRRKQLLRSVSRSGNFPNDYHGDTGTSTHMYFTSVDSVHVHVLVHVRTVLIILTRASK